MSSARSFATGVDTNQAGSTDGQRSPRRSNYCKSTPPAAREPPTLDKSRNTVTGVDPGFQPLSEGDRLARFFATPERDRMAEVDKQIRDEAGLDKNGWPKAAKPESDREIVDRATTTIVNVVRADDSQTAAAMEADVNATIAAIHAREREAEAWATALASIRDDFDNLPDAD